MEVIEVPDILVSKNDRLYSLRNQQIWRGVAQTIGIGSGIVKNGILYVLKELPASLQTFTPTGREVVGTTVNLVDERDSQVYRCIKMADGRWWLGENLKYNVAGSVYYNNDVANLAIYGRLYRWQEALDAAPEKWRVPSDEEWKTLETALGMPFGELDNTGMWRGADQNVGTKLKQGGESGQNLLLGGLQGDDGNYYNLGTHGYYWTSTESGSNAWYRIVHSSEAGVYRNTGNRANRFSVRLILNV